ncbi:MAG: ArdC family protein [Acidimicrobiales bacterium]
MKASDVMAKVVAELVAAIEAGADEWTMPWRQLGQGWPTNAVTGNRYRGSNAVWFLFAANRHGYPSPRWATYKQWAGVGSQVRRGERATAGIYWHTDPAANDDTSNDDDETPAARQPARCGWARAFHVFNAAQVDGDPDPDTAAVQLDPLERDAAAEAWFAAVPVSVRWGAGNPCYRRDLDAVVMPAFDAFHTAADAYATLAHELGHWTGHPSRLDRSFGRRFGDHTYAAEELVAELSSAFTCAVVGIDTVARHDHAAYLAHWCQLLRAQPSTLWTIAAKAQAAADHLASYQPPQP